MMIARPPDHHPGRAVPAAHKHLPRSTSMDRVLKTGTNLIVAGTLLGAALLSLLPRDIGFRLTAENKAIENLSAFAAGCAVLIATVRLCRSRSSVWCAIALSLCYLFLRELDYQKLFTPRSIESIGFYSDADIPLRMKLAAIAALTPFVTAGLYLACAGFRELRKTGRPRAAWWRTLIFAGGLLAVALASEKLLHRSGRFIEELFELGFISILLLVVALHAFRPDHGMPTTIVRPSVQGNCVSPIR